MLFDIFQNIKIPIMALLANKMRSFLTMLGVIIGVGSVIVIMAVGAGAQSLILSQIKSLGSNLVGVLPGQSDENGPPASAFGIVITTLTYDDALALNNKRNVPNIIDTVAYVKGVAALAWQDNKYDTNISGTTVGYLTVEGGQVDKGRFFTSDEEKNLSRVAVLGSTVTKELFGASDPVGQQIKFKNHTFTVIGTMKERGTVAFQNYDDQIFVPISTMQKIVLGVNHISLIRAKVDSEENIDKAIEDIKITLRDRHGISDSTGAGDDFNVRSANAALDTITTVTDALKYFLTAMAALSLIVGGIGIMNIMLISVRERTREIGLRKAVGARVSDILKQFLVEAVTITLLGGLIGIIGGIIVSYLAAIVIQSLDYSWDFVISSMSIALAVLVSMGVGLIFGLYPASKASKLEPVEALRYE